MQKSALKTLIKSYEVEDYGKTRNEAISACFNKLRNVVYKDIEGALINMQVMDVDVLEENEQSKVEKLFGFFMPKVRKQYTIKLKINCEIKYL